MIHEMNLVDSKKIRNKSMAIFNENPMSKNANLFSFAMTPNTHVMTTTG